MVPEFVTLFSLEHVIRVAPKKLRDSRQQSGRRRAINWIVRHPAPAHPDVEPKGRGFPRRSQMRALGVPTWYTHAIRDIYPEV